jgi:hypothetical protein
MSKIASIILFTGVVIFIPSLMSLNKYKTSTGYAIAFCSCLILVLGIILLTKKELIPSGSIPIIMGLLGLFIFILGLLQKNEIRKNSTIDINKKLQDSLVFYAHVIIFTGLATFFGSIYYYYNIADIEEDYNPKIAYSLQKLKKIKKQQEEIKNKQKELEIESVKELEKLKIENKDRLLLLDENKPLSPQPSPLTKSEVADKSPKFHISQILSPPDETKTNHNLKIEIPEDSDNLKHITFSPIISTPSTPSTPAPTLVPANTLKKRYENKNDDSDNELDMIMSKLRNQ